MSKRRTAYVIQRTEVQGLPRAYVLGCRAPRVTVLSQQFRAFNLIWALLEEGRLQPGDRVGVVGGGIGGLTAAAAAMLKGCSVVVAEQHQRLMHIQRRNTTRLLHPNIYEWPEAGAEESSTRFPCMNWEADYAGEVVARLDAEWEALTKQYQPEVHTDMRVTSVRPEGPDGRLVIRKDGEWKSGPCDVVVFAVGFGIESPVPGLPPNSYWENDSLEQSARGVQTVKSVLVSGLGDGGCIDVLRLKYSDFQHTKFADAVARHQGLEQYKRRLREIDRKLPTTDREKYLRDEYRKLNLPANLAESLGLIRTDTRVVLNGPDPVSPLSPNACILHRVAVWALVVAGKVTYKPGRIDKEAITTERVETGVKYFVPIEGSGQHGFDAVVIRHGPASCLGAFPEIGSGYTGITDTPAKDRTRQQMYPDGYYPARAVPQTNVSRAGIGPLFSTSDAAVPAQPAESEIPMPAQLTVEPATPVRFHSPERVSTDAAHLAEIERLISRLTVDTRAENYVPALEAANALEALLAGTGLAVPPDLWRRGHKALFDFEAYSRKRIEAGRGRYDLGRMQELVRRMRREPG